MNQWMLYGAYGYSGRLILKEAVQRGLRPIIAGRRQGPLTELASQYNLDFRCFSLDTPQEITAALHGCQLVLHAAGPFSRTSPPMLDACLQLGVGYLDITGEISVLEGILQRGQEIAARRCFAIPGVGFDVIPSDCLARIVADRVTNPTHLRLAFKVHQGQASRGTLLTMLEHAHNGNCIRQDGELIREDVGKRSRLVAFSDQPELAVAIPWGDVASSYYSTAIPNIEVYLAMGAWQRRISRWSARLMKFPRLRHAAQQLVGSLAHGASDDLRTKSSITLWAEAANAAGASYEARLCTGDGYDVTALGSVAVVEALLKGQPIPYGSFTPTQAFDRQWLLQQIHANLLPT